MKAYFAGGCFWCVTPIYKLYGVDRVVWPPLKFPMINFWIFILPT